MRSLGGWREPSGVGKLYREGNCSECKLSRVDDVCYSAEVVGNA